jgi:hypothetical protein
VGHRRASRLAPLAPATEPAFDEITGALTGQEKALSYDDSSLVAVHQADQKPADDERLGLDEQSFDRELIHSLSLLETISRPLPRSVPATGR